MKGWTSYSGGPRPVAANRIVEVMTRDHRSHVGVASSFDWAYPCYQASDILSWRLYEPEVKVSPIPVAEQSRRASLIEACINVAIGFGINYAANLLIFPFFGLHITPTANLALGAIYTVISVARSYAIRRFFNRRLAALARRLARVPA